MKKQLLAITFAACLTAAQPPAPEGRFSALCEIVPIYNPAARYTAYCDVAELQDQVSVRYAVYDGAHIPRVPISGELREIQHSLEHVPGHFPFMRFEIPAGVKRSSILSVLTARQSSWSVRVRNANARCFASRGGRARNGSTR